MRVALNNCVSADKDVRLQNEVISPQCRETLLDEEVISFWLSVSNLEQHQLPTFVAVQWAKRANGIGEWMALGSAVRRFNSFETSPILSYPPRPCAILFVITRTLVHDGKPVMGPNWRIFFSRTTRTFVAVVL
jgi:hypothetical protein